MPRNVRRFAWLWIVSFVVGLLTVLVPPPLTSVEVGLGATQNMESAFILGTAVVLFLILSPFFWLAVWRHKNWARWVLLLAFVASLPFLFLNPRISYSHNLLLVAATMTSAAIEALAFIFAFTGDARPWFRK